jgi:hypothetical protein
MQRSGPANDLGEVYFEFRYVGSSVRVAAIHSATGTESIVLGPANASAADLERLALGKLKATLARTRADR